MLEPSTPNQFPDQIQIPEPLIIINFNSEYETSEILNSRIDKQCKCKLLYLVKWADYKGTDKETSWLLASELGHASKVVLDFHLAYPSKPGPLPLVESWHFHSLQSLQENSLKKKIIQENHFYFFNTMFIFPIVVVKLKSKKKEVFFFRLRLTSTPLIPLTLDTFPQAVHADMLLWCIPFPIPHNPTLCCFSTGNALRASSSQAIHAATLHCESSSSCLCWATNASIFFCFSASFWTLSSSSAFLRASSTSAVLWASSASMSLWAFSASASLRAFSASSTCHASSSRCLSHSSFTQFTLTSVTLCSQMHVSSSSDIDIMGGLADMFFWRGEWTIFKKKNMKRGIMRFGRLLSATTFYGPASNTTSHGHVNGLMGSAFNEEILLSCQDPHLIAKIPSDPRSIPYHSSNSISTILQDSDTTLTKPPNSDQPLRPLMHYHRSLRTPNNLWEPWSHSYLHLSSSFHFSPLELWSCFHIPVSVFTFLFSIY